MDADAGYGPTLGVEDAAADGDVVGDEAQLDLAPVGSRFPRSARAVAGCDGRDLDVLPVVGGKPDEFFARQLGAIDLESTVRVAPGDRLDQPANPRLADEDPGIADRLAVRGEH